MATIDNYKIKITVDGQEKVVDLIDTVDELQSTINKAAAAGIAAFAALATSAVRMADDMVDLAEATGFSAGKIYQLNAALEASGGKFGDAGGLLKGFSKTLGDVEKGTTETLDALYKLGLSKSEIESLSDEQLFQAVINGLAGMEAGFERNRIAMLLTGKAGDAIDWKKMAEGTNKAVDPELEKRLQLAADAVQKIEESFRIFQKVALDAIAPILQGIKDFNITAEGAKQTIQILGSLIAAAFAAATVVQIAKIVKLVKDLGGAMRAAGAASAFLVGLSGVGLLAVAASAAAATAAYVALGKAMEGAAEEKAMLDGDTGTPTPGAGTPQREIGITAEEKQLAAIKEQTRQLREKNSEANKYQRIINNTIGLSQREADMIKAMADLERQAGNDKLTIQKQIDAELAKGKDSNAAIVTELQKQLAEVDKQLVIQKELKAEELKRIDANQKIVDAIKEQYLFMEAGTLAVTNAMEKEIYQKILSGKLSDKEAKRELERLRLIDSNNAKIKRLDEQIKIAKAKGDKDALKRLELEKDAVIFANDQISQSVENRYKFEDELQKSWLAGTVEAFQKIAESTTPYKQAQDAIAATWSKLGSAVDNFVDTGKFKFKDFAESVIKDIAKIIIKAQLLKAIQATLGFFGIGIPGLAAGGPAKANQPYIVGEKGPELFVPKSAGTVIPNNKIGMAKEGMATGAVNAPITNNYITNNISALDAKSVAQLFAENRKTLLGATETARKELAYGS